MPAPAANRRSTSLAGSSGPPMTIEFQPKASTAEPAPVRLCGVWNGMGRRKRGGWGQPAQRGRGCAMGMQVRKHAMSLPVRRQACKA